MLYSLRVWPSKSFSGPPETTIVPIFLGMTSVSNPSWDLLASQGSWGHFECSRRGRNKCHRGAWRGAIRPYTTYIETGWIEQPPLRNKSNTIRQHGIQFDQTFPPWSLWLTSQKANKPPSFFAFWIYDATSLLLCSPAAGQRDDLLV